jgi:hypothetical protein
MAGITQVFQGNSLKETVHNLQHFHYQETLKDMGDYGGTRKG